VKNSKLEKTMKKITLSLLFALTVICAGSSFAQTLINGNNIASFPYTITTSGSYKLTSNLTVSALGESAIVINAPNVTLDLGGYTISGPLVCTASSCNSSASSYGVQSQYAGVAIQNGFIQGFYTCAYAYFGRVENISVTSCQNGIYVSRATARHDTATNCSSTGIIALAGVVSESEASNNATGISNLLSSSINNNVLDNTSYGIYVDDGVVTGNTIIGNGTDLYLTGTTLTTKNNVCSSAAC
jgi:hypothetical protein